MANTNNVGRISVRTSKRSRTRNNLSHPVNTSCGIGDIHPLLCSEVKPGSKVLVDYSTLVRALPIVAPAWCSLSLKFRNYFVNMSDLTENFTSLLAGEKVTRGSLSFEPRELPNLHSRFLSLLPLIGAHITLWRGSTATDTNMNLDKIKFHDSPAFTPGSSADAWANLQSWPGMTYSDLENGTFYTNHMPAAWQSIWAGYDGPALNVGALFSLALNSANSEIWIPVENKTWGSFFELVDGTNAADVVPDYYNVDVVEPSSADFLFQIAMNVDSSPVYVCANLSSFGKRLRKCLLGSGFELNFNSQLQPSFMSFGAVWKAYFESYGLTLYEKYEDSNLCRLMRIYDDLNITDFFDAIVKSSYFINTSDASGLGYVPEYFVQYFFGFIQDFANMFYTEEVDFVSMHTREIAISSGHNNLQDVATMVGKANPLQPQSDIVGLDQPDPSNSAPDPLNSAGSFLPNWANITQLDLETQKRLYKVINRETVAGKALAKNLMLQGLGDYVNSVESQFLGADELDINVSQVTSMADTMDSATDSGMMLGERGAQADGYRQGKKFVLKNASSFGYFVCLCCVVPETTYSNPADLRVFNKKKLDFYNPEYDGLGMELNPKMVVTGSQVVDIRVGSSGSLDDPFGYAPRYSCQKVGKAISNGDFSLRSTRDAWSRYNMEKIVDVGECDFEDAAVPVSGHDRTVHFHHLITPDFLPAASPNYRFLGRFQWMALFERLFAYEGDPLRKDWRYFDSTHPAAFFDFCFSEPDKFMIQSMVHEIHYAPMLTLEDSFETKEDGTNGPTDVSIGKA